MEPGEGAFILIDGTSIDVTFVGEVPTGDVSQTLVAGFNLVASVVPQAGDLAALELEDDLTAFDATVYGWNTATQAYEPAQFLGADIGWDTGASPSFEVGESFFINVGSETTWTRTFNINE
jgi:hypothetical protein